MASDWDEVEKVLSRMERGVSPSAQTEYQDHSHSEHVDYTGSSSLDHFNSGPIQPNTSASIFAPPRLTAQKITRVHQDFDMAVSHQKPLWRLPSLWDKEPSHYDKKSPEFLFCTTHRRMSSCWRCNPAEVLPEALRTSTMYSFALFRSLGQLARRDYKHSAGLAEVQSTLMASWQRRQAQIGNGDLVQQEPYITTAYIGNKGFTELVEEKIQQNLYGLTLEDVGNALDTLKDNEEVKKAERLVQLLLSQLAQHDSLTAGQIRRLQHAVQQLKEAGKDVPSIPEAAQIRLRKSSKEKRMQEYESHSSES